MEALLSNSNYGLDRNGDGQISKREAANVKYLHIDKCEITRMDEICYFTALKKLYCYNNQLSSLDLSKNTELTYLDCDNNQLTSLDLSKNTALTYLSCDTNRLTSLNLSKNTALITLYCGGNQLTSLDVSNSKELTLLRCNGNQLTSVIIYKYNIMDEWLMDDIIFDYGNIITYIE